MTKIYNLDTLEITSDFQNKKSRQSLIYKAIQKHRTNTKLVSIIDAIKDENRIKKYWKTYHCNHALLQDGKKLSGSLCRKRWCTNCCRIKTAEMTNAYKKPLLSLGQLYFVTLTRPNVKERELKSEIKKLIKGFQAIKDNMRKTYGMKINGMRKIEITYNNQNNTYHPHFHLIQSDYQHAQKLVELWLNYFPSASIQAQNITAIDTNNEKSFIELFKYATKETTKDGQKYTGKVLDAIYRSIEGIRIYQTYGELKKLKEPEEKTQDTANHEWLPNRQEIWVWEQNEITWVNAYHEKLINTLETKYEHNKKEKRSSLCN